MSGDDDFIDFYDLLGCAADIAPDDLRKVYRRKARDVHPDKNPDDPNAAAVFDAVKSAFDVLSDPEQRRKFDAVRSAKRAKAEKFEKLDAANQKMRMDLAARERAAEEKVKHMAHINQAKLVQQLRAASVALVEEYTSKAAEAAAVSASAASAPAAATAAGPGSAAGPRRKDEVDSDEDDTDLEGLETEVFAAARKLQGDGVSAT